MSDDVITVDIISRSSDFSIPTTRLQSDVLRYADPERERGGCDVFLPEANFIDDVQDSIAGDVDWIVRRGDDGVERYVPRRLTWCGIGSNSSIPLFKELLSKFDGAADIVFTWENGEQSGFRLRDGVVTEHEVVLSLREEIS